MPIQPPLQPIRHLPAAAWPAGIALLLLPGLVWILADHSVWDGESSAFGRHSLAMWSSLAGDNDEPWAWLMLHYQTRTAPGLSWLTQGFAALDFLFGDVTRALLFSTWVAHAVALGAIAATARVLFPHRVMPACMAVLFVAAGPQFIFLSHRYVPEPWQLALVALSYLLAAKARDLSPVQLVCGLVILSAWGVLVHAATPAHLFLPGLWCVGVWFESLRKKRPPFPEKPWRALPWLALAFCSAVGALACYALHGSSILGHARGMGQGLRAWPLVARVSWLPASGLAFLLAWGVAKALPNRGARGFSMPGPTVRPVLLGIGLLHIAGVVAYFGLRGELTERSLHALAPATALWVAAMAHAVRRSRAPWILAGILLAQGGLAHAQAWGLRTGRLFRAGVHVRPIDRNGIALAEIHRLLDLTAYDGEQEARVVAVSVPWLNADTLNFHASAGVYAGKPFCFYSALGDLRRAGQAGLDVLAERKPRFVISLRRRTIERESDPTASAGERARQALERSPAYRRIPFDSAAGILLYERLSHTPGSP